MAERLETFVERRNALILKIRRERKRLRIRMMRAVRLLLKMKGGA